MAILIRKLAELESMANDDADAYRFWRRRFERLHFALGIPATVLAAVAGATAFGDSVPNVVVGLCAVLAATLAGIQTIVRPDRRARFNQTQQFVFARLSMESSKLRDLGLLTISLEEAQTKLDDLYDRYHSARAQSPE